MSVGLVVLEAIDTLTTLKAKSTPEPWTRTDEIWEGAGRYEVTSPDTLVTSDGDGIGSIGNLADADLIVALHRSIDGQLAVLQRFLDQGMPLEFEEPIMLLARSIVGSGS